MSVEGAPPLGADGKDYRANFVHPLSEQISTLSDFTPRPAAFQPAENRLCFDQRGVS
jgi:hypothetical protein